MATVPAVACARLVRAFQRTLLSLLLAVTAAPRAHAALHLPDKPAEALFKLLSASGVANMDHMEALRYFHKHPEHAEKVYSRVAAQDEGYAALIIAAKLWRSGLAAELLPAGYKQYGKGTYAQCMTPTLAVNVLFTSAKSKVSGSGGGLKEFSDAAADEAESAGSDWLKENVPYWGDLPDICHFAFNTDFPTEQQIIATIQNAYQRPVRIYKAVAAGDYETAFAVLLDAAGGAGGLLCEYLAAQYHYDAIPLVGNIFKGACKSVAGKVFNYGLSALGAVGKFIENTAESLVQDPPMETLQHYELYFRGGALGYNPVATSVMELQMKKSTPDVYIGPVFDTCVNWYDAHRLSHSSAVEVCTAMKERFSNQVYANYEADDYNSGRLAYIKQKTQELAANKAVLVQLGVAEQAPYIDAKISECVASRGKQYHHLQKFGLEFGIQTNPVADCSTDLRKALQQQVRQWQHTAQVNVESATSSGTASSTGACGIDGMSMACGTIPAWTVCRTMLPRPCGPNGDFPCCLAKATGKYAEAALAAAEAVKRSDTRACRVRPTDALVVECAVKEIYDHVTVPGGYVVPECNLSKGFATDVCKVFNPTLLESLDASKKAKAAYVTLSKEPGAAVHPASFGLGSVKDPQIVGTSSDRLAACQSLLGSSACKLAPGSKYVGAACCKVEPLLTAVGDLKTQSDKSAADRAAKLAMMQQLEQKLAPACTAYKSVLGLINPFNLVCTSQAKVDECNAVADPIGRYSSMNLPPTETYPYARCTLGAPGRPARSVPVIVTPSGGSAPPSGRDEPSGGRPAPGSVEAARDALTAVGCEEARGVWLCSNAPAFTTCKAFEAQGTVRSCRAERGTREREDAAELAAAALKTLGCGVVEGRPGQWICARGKDEALAACEAFRGQRLVRSCSARR